MLYSINMKHLLLLVIFSACVAIESVLVLKWLSMSHELVSYLLWVFLIPYNGLGVFLSKLTELQARSNRLALSGNVNIFQPYFTGPSAFDGILRKS